MEGIEIREIKPLNSKIFRAQASVAFKLAYGTWLVIKGFRVGKSKYEEEPIWVQEPSYNTYGKWNPIFFLENKYDWEELKHEIVAACLSEGIVLDQDGETNQILEDMDKLLGKDT